MLDSIVRVYTKKGGLQKLAHANHQEWINRAKPETGGKHTIAKLRDVLVHSVPSTEWDTVQLQNGHSMVAPRHDPHPRWTRKRQEEYGSEGRRD